MVGLNYTLIYRFNDKVLKQKELVIFSRCINAVNDFSNKVGNTINGIECRIKIFILYSDRINNTPIDDMEYASYIR